MNLVGPGPLDPHYVDCESAVGWLEHPVGAWADLGSGAGFPGIVFAALHSSAAVDLVDSRQKRCTFLEAVLAEAGQAASGRPAPLRVLCTRIEDLPDQSYDGVLARALAPPPEVLEHARRLLKRGGTALLFLQGDAELPHMSGFETVHVQPYLVEGRRRKSVGLRRL
jgi:16S rRNA G527 N7-methylase RsmG